MGMPITVEISGGSKIDKVFKDLFDYFVAIDRKFSPYKASSEVSLINKGKLNKNEYSLDMKKILAKSQETKKLTRGYFNVYRNNRLDPSGLVKGWAIWQASKILSKAGVKIFYIEAGGDIQVGGKKWKIGIKNPFNPSEIVKVLKVDNQGVATSGTYERGNHIYSPIDDRKVDEIISLTVIGKNIYQADRFATAAFAMGKDGINFLEELNGFEGYMIDSSGLATSTSGFEKYVYENN